LGGKIGAVFPGRYPAEVLHAAGVLPVEVWDPPGPIARASGHLQPFVCGVGLAGLELLLSESTPRLDCLLFPHLCDTVQNLFTVVRDCIELPVPAFLFYTPRNVEHVGVEEYLVSQVRRLAQQVSGVTGRKVTDAALALAGEAVDRAHLALARLYAARAGGTCGSDNSQFYRTVRLREFVPPDDFVAEVERLLAEFERPPEPSPTSGTQGLQRRPNEESRFAAGPKLVLSGVLPDRDLLALLDQRSVRICEDDLISCGRRFSRAPVSPSNDPWKAAAARLLSLPPCTSIASPVESRVAWLANLAHTTGSAGVLMHTVKFCELELFDHPFVVQGLRKRGIQVLVVESELHQPQLGQLATRLDAFLEVLS